MEYAILIIIGLVTGLFGGMLGIGGSMVMIPAMTLAFGENQHLYHASAMVCNFFIATASIFAHKKAKALVPDVLRYLIPAAVVGILIGVAASNLAVFAGDKSYILARAFGGFLLYVAAYNGWQLYAALRGGGQSSGDSAGAYSRIASAVIGGVSGIGAGLLGIGAGTISTPLQQLLLKMPITKAMSNSAATIVCVALIGATYKNLTLGVHGLTIAASLKIVAVVTPTAIIGGFVGGQLMHKLPVNVVRAVFVCLLLAAAYKLIGVSSGV